MSIVELIHAGNLSARLAAMFWIAMERGASLIVAADPPSAGKTTTLSALLAFTPPEAAVYFTRGQGETFALPPVSDAYPTYILINEMSDHIPVYTWDDHARKAFDLLSQGYRLATTMHADTAEGVLSQLRSDLHVPDSQIANLTFIVPLHIGQQPPVKRRVQEVSFLQPAGESLHTGTLATWDASTDSFEVLEDAAPREAFARWAKLTPGELEKELEEREAFLKTLTSTGVESVREVAFAIEGYYDQLVKKDS
jgi:hypothetical protein